MTLTKPTIGLLGLLIASVHVSNIADANELVSFSVARTITDQSGVSHLQRSVICKNDTQNRAIRKTNGSRKWCVSGSSEHCHNTKLVAARKACALPGSLADSDASEQPANARPPKSSNHKGVSKKASDKQAEAEKNLIIKQALTDELEEIDAKIKTIRQRHEQLKIRADGLKR